MSDTRTATVRTGDSAIITYGDTDAVAGKVAKIVTSRTGNLRRVGITPDGTDVVAWFAPDSTDPMGDILGRLVSVGGSTVAYL